MRLDQELVKRKLCESRQEAQECIEQGNVLVDAVVTTKKTRQVDENSLIVVTKKRSFVSRGGEKLEGILLDVYKDKETIRKNLERKTAIDVGSSTGGFTDCLLSYGVTSVTAIDVGKEQLHAKLRNDERITLFENTDIRNFKTTNTFNIIVADLSFISLEKVLDVILPLGSVTSEYFLLIKPQFEVGFGNTKKGIVKDMTLVQNILDSYIDLFNEKKLHNVQIFPCAITGGDGNQEYFIYAQK
jgi:23S rRNA (cytidine1920-2'-O)/16S rRNA (cytidine1409-2'-O)-methyltransferase